MKPVGVRGFYEQDVRARRIFEMAQNRLVRLAEIAGKKQPMSFVVPATDVQLHERRPEDMASVEKFKRYAAGDLPRLMEMHWREKLHERIDILLVVKRLEERLSVPAAAFVDVFEVAFLKEARIAQHHGAKIGSRLPRKHPSAKTLPD